MAEYLIDLLDLDLEIHLTDEVSRRGISTKCWESNPTHPTTSGWPCRAHLKAWWSQMNTAYAARNAFAYDPLVQLDHAAEELASDLNYCEHLSEVCIHCRFWGARVIRKEIKALWDKLPEFLALESLSY